VDSDSSRSFSKSAAGIASFSTVSTSISSSTGKVAGSGV